MSKEITATAYTPEVIPECNWVSLDDFMLMKKASFTAGRALGRDAGLEAAAKIADDKEDYWEIKCDTWPEMQPNAVAGCQSIAEAIRALITK